ncbi:MAG TPA: amino acid permease [Thermomicrobiaceae bacterium]|nr:amino acid permease [Thermomicrobiaceae bacterium]
MSQPGASPPSASMPRVTEAGLGDAPPLPESRSRLRRALDLRAAVALGVGGTIGGGIFVLIGTAAGRAGPAVLVAFGLAFVASGLIALPYAELACRYPTAGGGYAFAHAVLGRDWGFLMGWDYWGAYVFLSGYVTLGFGGYLHTLTGLPTTACALGLVLAITVLNLGGVRLSGTVQTGIVALVLVSLVGFGLLGLPHLQAANFSPFFSRGASGVVAAALLAFLSFGGFDMIAAAGEEVQDPERTLPRAIVLTLLLVLGVYLLVTVVAVGILSAGALGGSLAPLADAAGRAFGGAGRRFVALAAVLTTAATANAVLLVTSRISFAMARDGLLPSPIGRVRDETGVPWVAVLMNGTLLALVALTGSITLAATIGGFLYVLHFVVPLASLVRLRRRRIGQPAFQTPLPWIVLPLAFAGCLVLVVASGATGFLGGIGWLLLGVVLYLVARRIRRSAV